ncbi:putative WD40/YVTN repeat-like-containing domain superfamily [Helianthus debilis subsp. tardiflorus]
MDGLNEPDENDKILNLLDPDAEKQIFGPNCETGHTSGTKMAYLHFIIICISFHYCKYRRDENQLYVFADDSVPRWLTSAYHVDFDTMAGARAINEPNEHERGLVRVRSLRK